MDATPFSMGFIITALFVGLVILFGLFTMFVRAQNIERNALVGGLTVLTGLIAVAFLVADYRLAHPLGAGGFVSIGLVSLLGYVIGRIIDWLLGPVSLSHDTREGTYGADLSD